MPVEQPGSPAFDNSRCCFIIITQDIFRRCRVESFRILIVDDEPSICSMVTRFLEMNNYQGDVASNGKQALEMLEKNSYQLVLSDIKMPEMDGISFMQAAKELKSDLLFIIMSGYGTLESAIQALKLGAINFIKKPLSVIELVSTIKKAEDILFRKTLPYKISPYIQTINKHMVFSVKDLNERIDMVVDYLVMELPHFSLSEVRIDNLTLALYEALNNAIEHGSLDLHKQMTENNTVEEFQDFTREKIRRLEKKEYAEKQVVIDLAYHSNQIIYTITDSGKGFDHRQYLKTIDNRLYVDSINKGLFLIMNTVDRIEFNDAGNALTMIIETKKEK